jgi:pSer/pThr/pTyr-binding forkhead associated (FHA) protein
MGAENAVITVMSGADDGKTFPLSKDSLTLGRLPDDDISLPYDTRTSRRHARITRADGHFYIEDVGPEGKGSTNGTYLNDTSKKITGKTPLLPGDMILLGSVWLQLHIK